MSCMTGAPSVLHSSSHAETMSRNTDYVLVGSNNAQPTPKKGCVIASISVIVVLLVFLMCITIFLPSHGPLDRSDVINVAIPSYLGLCKLSRYPQFCISAISSFTPTTSQGVVKKNVYMDLVGQSMRAALNGVNEQLYLSRFLHGGLKGNANTSDILKSREEAALRDCVEVLGDAADLISDSLEVLSENNHMLSVDLVSDIHTWMSAALTDHITCMDGLDPLTGNASDRLRNEGSIAEKLLSNSLAFVSFLYASPEDIDFKELAMPLRWLKSEDFRLLNDPALVADVIVSKDGNGNYSKIQDAVDAAPTKCKKRFTIYIRRGVYVENVDVSKYKTNLMFIGDGINNTIISADKNVVDGATTFTSATVAVKGNGFLARDIAIRNTAGAIKHQAVALRVGADESAFYRCSFEGYQDTLYTHSQRQFFRDCVIYGTVDYIFGNAAAFFQDSTLLARVPLPEQKNTYTAQGRTDPNQNTGLIFQGCVVDGSSELKNVIQKYPTYLGRPWKEYSRTVFLKSYEGSVINPAGWLEWDGEFALHTCYYAEYACTGPGAAVAERCSWSCQIHNQSVADEFTVGKFVSGEAWLPATSFPYDINL